MTPVVYCPSCDCVYQTTCLCSLAAILVDDEQTVDLGGDDE